MLTFVVFVFILQAVVSQEQYRCDCGLFTEVQIKHDPNPTPLAFNVSYTVDASSCTLPEGPTHPCAQFCSQWAVDETAGGVGLCYEAPDSSNMCYGGKFCEIVHADGHQNVKDEPINMYYRIPECINTHFNWTETIYTMREELCCSKDVYESCIDDTCACYRYSYSYCECGIFIPEMFEALNGNEIALPLKVIGQNSTDQPQNDEFCDSVGSPLDPCQSLCRNEGNTAFDTYSLADIPAGSDQTYGQLYCKAIWARYDEYTNEFNGVNTTLGVWNRAPRCPNDEWYDQPLTTDDETLCCDENGNNVYPCTAQFWSRDDAMW